MAEEKFAIFNRLTKLGQLAPNFFKETKTPLFRIMAPAISHHSGFNPETMLFEKGNKCSYIAGAMLLGTQCNKEGIF
ncbi:MAG: hypothetical protein BWZ03_00370 [bacterium ADurb.BinA186]|nr:MAG: hypothetical protein BWZ03_00370 [bacterium ADurb.BinA186]